MLILGIETSCDETAAAVVEDGRRVLSDLVSSQVEIHRRWGGVVPEIASRNHIRLVMPVVDQALTQAGVSHIDAIAVTAGPGLVGPLLVGVQVAKGLGLAWNRPVLPINHLEGHLSAIQLTENPPEFPFLALTVSGGHTALYACELGARYRILAQTRDDAAGEAFDKGAKLLGLGYPGGAVIDQLARQGNRIAITFPRTRVRQSEFDFSFSGLKTALLHHVQKHGLPQGQGLADLCASYQEAIVDVLISRAILAAERFQFSRLVLCGGVAANSRLRQRLTDEVNRRPGLTLHIASPRYCTDNAAMIAAAGALALGRGEHASLDFNARPSWKLG